MDTAGREKNSNIHQGVVSTIEFPLGQDERAVSRAVSHLLQEGWKFIEITKTCLCVSRSWEVNTMPCGEVVYDK